MFSSTCKIRAKENPFHKAKNHYIFQGLKVLINQVK
jgi:hypothetical protein